MDRHEEVLIRRACGESVRSIATSWGVSSERVRQVESKAKRRGAGCSPVGLEPEELAALAPSWHFPSFRAALYAMAETDSQKESS